jgi:cytochrome P450
MTSTRAWLDEISVEMLQEDPDPIFARLRREAPIAFIPAIGTWVGSTWKECWQIASDSATWGGSTDPAAERVFGQPSILSADGDIHADLRSMVDPHLRPRAVKRYIDDLVKPIAKKYLDGMRARGAAELMAEYFEPISVRALGDMLGFNAVDSDGLRHWFHDLSTGFINKALLPELFAISDAVTDEIKAITDRRIERLSMEPDDTGLSHWLHDGMPTGQARTKEYIYPTLFVVLLGGMQEPGHGAGSVMLGLFSRPEQLRRVIDDPSQIPRAVTEGMRWIAPIWTAIGRRPNRDVEIAGVTVQKGETVMLTYGSANRDEAEFEQPDVFDIDRPEHPHLAFGTGRHSCSGLSFAQAVIRIAIEELLIAFPTIELDPDHEPTVWGWVFRAPKQLHVRWTT